VNWKVIFVKFVLLMTAILLKFEIN